MDAHEYSVHVDWTADRLGVLSSIELPAEINIEVATPPQFPKGIPNVWSPEHLFTAAVVSCFMTTFLSIAENSKLDFSKFSCSAKGKLEQVAGKFQMTSVLLQPSICIADTTQKEKVARVMQKAEAACLISNSITSAVQLNPTFYV